MSTSLNPNLRGQRISREELIAESQEVLLNAGVGNHSRAQFLVEVAQEVVGSQNPLFCQLQPKIHSHESESWVRAFGLVFQYLVERDLQSTLSAVEVEFGQGELPQEITRRGGEFVAEFQALMNYAPPPRGTTFKERVSKYIEEVEQRDIRLHQEEEEQMNQRRAMRRNLAQEVAKISPKINASEDKSRLQSRSSQPRNRTQKRTETRPSPQITPKPTVTPVDNKQKPANTSSSKPKSAIRRTIKKKRPVKTSELSDDFVIEEVIPPKDAY